MSTLSQAERDKLPESAFGDAENRKFPIVDQSDVDAAAHLIGRADDPEAVKRRIIKIAKRLGLKIPDAWKEDGDKDNKPCGLERKTVEFEIKELGDSPDGTGSYSVYAADFLTIDRAGEKIAPGAFENLEEFTRDGFMTLNHDWKCLPIATISSAKQDARGLLVTGDFHGTPEAQAVRTVMKERRARGKSCKASIGYVVTKDAAMKSEDGTPYRLLKGLNIYEWSYVNVPANVNAVAIDVKGGSMPTAAESVKEMTEGDDDSGGATVPADEGNEINKGRMVKWKANCHAPGMKAGCGMVKSIHTKGVVPGVDNDAEASEDEPHARVHVHTKNDDGEYAPMGDRHMAHPVKCLTAMKNFTLVGRKPDADIGKSIGIISIKGQYLGDTDETMACAALDRLNSMLFYYLYACVRSDKDVATTVKMAGGAIDEYKETVLAMLTALLEEDDDDGPVIIDRPSEIYPMGMMSYDALATKYLANLATYDSSRDGAVTVLSLEARSHSVVSALGEIRDLGRKFAETRLKEGRMLSSSTRSRIQAALDALAPLVGDLTALLDESTPKPKRDANGETGNTLESSSLSDKAASAKGPGRSKADPAAVRAALADFAHFDFLQNSGASL